jgi:hypothetical protein
VALGYNAVVTGHPLLFPYQAFAPLDGLGFGRRAILDYELTYTVGLALRSNAEVVWQFLSTWGPFGALGTVLAVVGGYATHRRGWDWQQAVLAGVAVSVVVGNVCFWGNRNVLGSLADPTDGLVSTLGPYYHFDLLVPASAFAAAGLLAVVDAARGELGTRVPDGRARPVALAVLVVTAGVLGAATVSAAAPQVRENAALTDHYGAAYDPFQALRNDPGYDGRTVYALSENQFGVVDAYPDREHYRYVYRGSWSPYSIRPVTPALRRVRVVSGDALAADVRFGLPEWTESVTLTLSSGDERVHYTLDDASADGSAAVTLLVDDGRVTAHRPPAAGKSASVALNGSVTVSVLVDGGHGAGLRYRVRVPVNRPPEGYRALTPYRELCTDLRNCGGGAAYVPGVGPDGTFVNATVRAA